MHQTLCICSLVPTVQTSTRWVFIQHHSEGWKTTGSTRLAHRVLEHSQLCTFRSRTEPPQPVPEFGVGRRAYLLFPIEGVETVRPETLSQSGEPVTVVVPDGTWGQARKMVRSVAGLADLPVLSLPEDAYARLSVREETRGGGMSTLDAVAWVLGALEGEHLAAPLLDIWRTQVERTLQSRGTPLQSTGDGSDAGGRAHSE